jgi:hypothetical protein
VDHTPSAAKKGTLGVEKSAQPPLPHVDNLFIDMSPLLQTHPSCAQRAFPLAFIGAMALAGPAGLAGCGAVTCPEPLSNVDGVCLKLDQVAEAERCDGTDNDGDTEVDEDWPKLGEPCGEAAGECVEGEWVCAVDGDGVVCDGGVGPVAEICDGKDNDCDGTPDNGPNEVCDGEDNDCDGFIDEGVLSTRVEVFDGHATVTAVDGGYVVARIAEDELRVLTYDSSGEATGNVDATNNPVPDLVFMTSDSSGSRVLVSLGRLKFHAFDVHVDSDLVPIILGTQQLHPGWDQPTQQEGIPAFGAYAPPLHPRITASPPRFVGYPDIVTFALAAFGGDNLAGLTEEPTVVGAIPPISVFDAAGPFLVWEQGENIRAGRLLDVGNLELDIDVAPGSAPSIAERAGGIGVAYIHLGSLRLSELAALSVQCWDGGFCDEEVASGALEGPTALAYDEAMDTWLVAAGTRLVVVGRFEGNAIVKQSLDLASVPTPVRRIDVAVSGHTAAVVQVSRDAGSALTFLGCF